MDLDNFATFVRVIEPVIHIQSKSWESNTFWDTAWTNIYYDQNNFYRTSSSTSFQLYYPEIYLLYGGYKEFFKSYRNLCEPSNYLPMAHEDYINEYKMFRKKAHE